MVEYSQFNNEEQYRSTVQKYDRPEHQYSSLEKGVESDFINNHYVRSTESTQEAIKYNQQEETDTSKAYMQMGKYMVGQVSVSPDNKSATLSFEEQNKEQSIPEQGTVTVSNTLSDLESALQNEQRPREDRKVTVRTIFG